MYRIDVSTALAVKPAYPAGGQGGFFAGCDGVNTFGTDLDHHWYNRVQEEIVNVILGGGLALDAGDDGQMYAAIIQLIENALSTYPTGRLLRRQKLITSGSLVKATDLLPETRRIVIWLYSASGGSGGVKGGTSTMPVSGAGGAGGASMKSFLVADLDASEPYMIGAKGLGGAPTVNGTDGGDSSFGSAPYFSVSGGKGGRFMTGSAPGTADSSGGIGIGGDINLRGQAGDPGWSDASTAVPGTVLPGAGSPGPYGGFGPPGRVVSVAGNGVSPDANSAAGPTGANATYNTVASTANGADGSDGFMIIEEYDR